MENMENLKKRTRGQSKVTRELRLFTAIQIATMVNKNFSFIMDNLVMDVCKKTNQPESTVRAIARSYAKKTLHLSRTKNPVKYSINEKCRPYLQAELMRIKNSKVDMSVFPKIKTITTPSSKPVDTNKLIVAYNEMVDKMCSEMKERGAKEIKDLVDKL